MWHSTTASVAVVLLVLGVGSAHADTVMLADGTEHEGTIIRETPDTIVFAKRMGGLKGSIVIQKADIISYRTGKLAPDTVLADSKALSADAEKQTDPKKAVEAWLKVADFFERHPGYSAYARASYEKVLLFDADHAATRARLGYVKEGKEWKKPEPVVIAPKSDEAPEGAIAARAPALPADELTIGLRKDALVVKKLLDDQAARIEALRERQKREAELARYDYGYGDRYSLIGNDIFYYGPGFYGPGFFYGGGFGYGGYGCGNGYYGSGFNCCHSGYGYSSGLSIGFRGRIGSNVRFSGSINNGYFGSGFRGGLRF